MGNKQKEEHVKFVKSSLLSKATEKEKKFSIIDLIKPLMRDDDAQSPYFNAQINGTDIMAFLDTGAEMSIINETFYRAIAGENVEYFKK